jgi:hypothetical protein
MAPNVEGIWEGAEVWVPDALSTYTVDYWFTVPN